MVLVSPYICTFMESGSVYTVYIHIVHTCAGIIMVDTPGASRFAGTSTPGVLTDQKQAFKAIIAELGSTHTTFVHVTVNTAN